MEEETRENRRPDFEALLREDREYQSAYDRKVSQALATARANWDRERQAETERQRAELEAAANRELEQGRADLARQQAAFDAQVRQVAVAQALQERGLDARFAPWLTGQGEEDSARRVEEFSQLFQAALSQAVTGRMRGEGAPREPEQPPELTRESLRGMSPGEINRNWRQVASLLREQ